MAEFSVPADNRILFYLRDRATFGFLSNFAASPILLDGESWPTVEHYYQAQKSLNPTYQELVRMAYSPGHAKRLGADPSLPRVQSRQSWFRRNQQSYRPGWHAMKLDVMNLAVRAKFFQNLNLAELLLQTNEAEIIEDSGRDEFWGEGANGSGLNSLGRILMQIRRDLRITVP